MKKLILNKTDNTLKEALAFVKKYKVYVDYLFK